MNSLLLQGFESFGLRIASIDGGGFRNANPSESEAEIVVDEIHHDAFALEFNQLASSIKKALKVMEPNLVISAEVTDVPTSVMELGVQEGITRAIYAAHNGVYAMSPTMEDLVQTSNNIARVKIKEGKLKVMCLTRSSVESSKIDLAN